MYARLHGTSILWPGNNNSIISDSDIHAASYLCNSDGTMDESEGILLTKMGR